MKKILLAAALFLFAINVSYSQQARSIKGVIQDSTGSPLPGASVKLLMGTDSVSIGSGMNGNFTFNSVKVNQITLSVAFVGFQKFSKQYNLEKEGSQVLLEAIKLKELSNKLNEVVITGIVPVRVKEDTVEYNAAAYKVREGDAVDEMLKKLPGVTVDKDGNVTIQGKPLTQLRINGKDFFGSDVASAIQNLPADIIKNLQFIDDYGDQAKLTGIKSGEPNKVLNINIQPDKKKGYTVRGTGGLGNESRYIATLRGNTFKDERQISFESSMNNTNTRGGGGDGITNSKSVALNYRNEWGKKISSYGGLNYNGRDNSTERKVLRQNIYETFTKFDDQKSFNNSNNSDGQLFWNFEYRIDTMNYVKLSPTFSTNSSDAGNNGSTFTTIKKATSLHDNTAANSSFSRNYGTTLLLNHKFAKKGRNFSVWANANRSVGGNDRDADDSYLNTDSAGVSTFRLRDQYTENTNSNTRTGVNVSYTEPLRKATFLELSYNWNYADTRTSRSFNEIDPVTQNRKFIDSLSNEYSYQFITNRFGLNYRDVHLKYNYTVGLGFQPAELQGQNISRNINTSKKTINWIPSARFVYQFSKQKTFTANYSGRNNQPSFYQLQPLTDNSNLQNTTVGNPDLKPEFYHGLNLDYNESDWQAGHTLFAGVSVSQTNNRIITRRMLIAETFNQVTTYQNANGFYSVRGNYSYGKPFQERRYTLTYFGGSNFNNNISYNNNNRIVAKNTVIDQGLKFRIDIKDHIDAEFNTSYSINRTTYSLATLTARKTNRINIGLNGRTYFIKDLTLGYDLNKTINNGYTYSNNANPFILNAYMEYRFMKGNKGSVRLHGFDLLDQNNGITRDVFDNQIVDTQTNRLARYFLMSFNLRLNKFGGK